MDTLAPQPVVHSPSPPSDAKPLALDVKGLRKSYGAVEVLHGVDLTVPQGERIALMGRSGSGKSTLLNCICGIEPFEEGEITVGQQAIGDLRPPELEQMRRERIGYVFQTFHLLPTLSAVENVAFPGQLIRMSPRERNARAEHLLARVGMSHRKDHKPSELSGGERQRVALARAVMNRPRLILADEPTGSLDSTSGDQVLELIQQVSQGEQIAVLLVTHDPNSARICSQAVRMQDGRILQGS